MDHASLQKFRYITRRHHVEPGDYEMQFHVVRLVGHRKTSFRKKSRSEVCSSINALHIGKHHKVVSEGLSYPAATFTLDA